MTPETENSREHDLVVYGATGFVGTLTAAYLAEPRPPARGSLSPGARRPSSSRSAASCPPRPPTGRSSSPTAATPRRWTRWLPRRPRSRPPSAPTCATASRWSRPAPTPARTTPTSPARCCSCDGSIDAADARGEGQRRPHRPHLRVRLDPVRPRRPLPHEYAEEIGAGALGETTFVVRAMAGGISGGTIDSMRGQLERARPTSRSRRRSSTRIRSPGRARRTGRRQERDPRASAATPTRRLSRPVRDGHGQHPRGAPEQRAAGPCLRPRAAYRELMQTGGAPLGAVKAGGIVGGLGALVGGHVPAADAQAARPRAARAGRGAERAGAREAAFSR